MNELKLIKYIQKKSGKSVKGVKTGIGDDCAVLDYDRGHYMLWASDMLVEKTHFDLKKASLKDIGRKAVSVNVSDIAAMGGKPEFILVSLGVPKKMEQEDIKNMYEGIFSACRKYGVKVIGGDTNKAKELIVEVSILGKVEKKHLVQRNGANVGDIVLVTGPVRDGKKDHLRFIPRIKESKYLVNNYKINSMIDVSDGIAVDIIRICEASKKGCRIYSGNICLAGKLSLKDALYYGESFELLFTMTHSEAKKLFCNCKKEKFKFFKIGEIVSKKDGKVLVDGNGKTKDLKSTGFRHL